MKDNFKGGNAKETFIFKIDVILLQGEKKKTENIFFSASSIKGLEGGENCVKATYHKSSKREIGYSISLIPTLRAKERSMN